MIEADFGNKQRDRLPDSVIAEVEAVPGVSDAQGDVMGFASIIGKDGKPLVSGQTAPPTFGSVALTRRPGHRGRFVEGASPQRRRPGRHRQGQRRQGPLRGGRQDPDRRRHRQHASSRSSGIARFGDADSPGGATFSLFDLPTAQEFVGQARLRRRRAGARATARSATRSWPTASSPRLGKASETEVLTGAEITKENQSDIQKNLRFFTIFLNVVAFIALFVVLLRDLQRLLDHVAQRKRENALMRAIGASRRQVTVSLLLESVVVGLVGSIIGLGLGMLLAMGLKAAFSALGLDLPSNGLTVLPRTIILTLVVGLLVTVLSAAPARAPLGPRAAGGRHAGHRAGVDERHEGPHDQRPRLLVVEHRADPSSASSPARRWPSAPGVLILFVALFVLGPLIARPVAKVLGRPHHPHQGR